MRKTLLFVALAACFATAACNTVKGLGRDMTSLGHAVSDTADDAKKSR